MSVWSISGFHCVARTRAGARRHIGIHADGGTRGSEHALTTAEREDVVVPWNENYFPRSMVNLPLIVRAKAIEIANANAVLVEGYEEGRAIRIASRRQSDGATAGFLSLTPLQARRVGEFAWGRERGNCTLRPNKIPLRR